MKFKFKRLFAVTIVLSLSAPCAVAKTLKSYHSEAGLSCNDCHTGKRKTIPMADTCLECHGPREDLRAAVKQPKSIYFSDTNPHYSLHFGYGLECTECHSQHKESTLYCNECHHSFDYSGFPNDKKDD